MSKLLTRVVTVASAVVFLCSISAPTRETLGNCPCDRTCAELFCIKTFENETNQICLQPRKLGTNTWHAWLNIWCSHQCMYTTAKAKTGMTIDLYQCDDCVGVCSAQGCNAANDPEDGSYSCGGTCFVLFEDMDQKWCVENEGT